MRIFITGGSGFIGTNLLEALFVGGHEVRDYSLTPPPLEAHRAVWQAGDLLNAEALLQACRAFSPDAVIHLAARAECDETTTVEEGYRANTDGTRNILEAIKRTPSVQRAIITSTQYVCGPGRLPEHDEDYFPHTVYGQSKVITEQLTRKANLPCCWTLTRPTNIWGPWHWRYPQEFWRIAARGLYVHPAGAPVVRCYGYVGNIVAQMLRILELPEDAVHQQTFYLGDPADDIYRWANGFCLALRGQPAPRVPRPILRMAGLLGDGITTFTGKPFYITSSRYRSMVTDYMVPMEKTLSVLGKGPFLLEQGIEESVKWLRQTVWKEDFATA
jgi:nucleoside-diphosphate-sugar epimerase